MDISEAWTEGFAILSEFHNSFDTEFKVSIASFFHIRNIVVKPDGAKFIKGLVIDTNEPWNKQFANSIRDPKQLLDEVIDNTNLLGIVQISSAMDEFISNIKADYKRWHSFSGATKAVRKEKASPEREPLEELCVSYGWSIEEFNSWHNILKYFRLLRNCIVHRSSQASQALSTISQSSELHVLTKQLSKRDGVEVPVLPFFQPNLAIQLEPKHVVLALTVTMQACYHVNYCFTQELGREGITFLAAYHTLLVDQPRVNLEAYKSVESVINYALTNRYHIQELDRQEAIVILKKLGLTRKSISRFKEIYGSSPSPYED